MVQLNEMPANGGQGMPALPAVAHGELGLALVAGDGGNVGGCAAGPLCRKPTGVGAGASARANERRANAGRAGARLRASHQNSGRLCPGPPHHLRAHSKVFPDGLVVDSGYTNLMRPPLSRSWLVPGAAQAARASSLVEAREPGSVCVGLVFVTALPRSRLPKPRPYDYVVLQAYPAGQYPTPPWRACNGLSAGFAV